MTEEEVEDVILERCVVKGLGETDDDNAGAVLVIVVVMMRKGNFSLGIHDSFYTDAFHTIIHAPDFGGIVAGEGNAEFPRGLPHQKISHP
jgi:hypothetical protein